MAGDINFNVMDDYSDSFLSAGKPFLQGARLIRGANAKRSITALSKDLIMQFPVLMSAGIDQDSAVTIAKALERMYASMYLTVWTADSAFGVDASMNGVRDFVKRYHNNDDIPDMITYGGNILSLTDQLLGLESTIEGAVIKCVDVNYPATETARLWDNTADQLNLGSINDLYNPDRQMINTIKNITKSIESDEQIEPATEAGKPPKAKDYAVGSIPGPDASSVRWGTYLNPDKFGSEKKNSGSGQKTTTNTGGKNSGYQRKTYTFSKGKNSDGGSYWPSSSNPGSSGWKKNEIFTGDNTMDNVGNTALTMMGDQSHVNRGYNETQYVNKFDHAAAIVRNDKMTSLEPTLIDVTFLVVGGDQGTAYNRNSGRQHTVGLREQRAIVGVKTMVRFISSQYMIPNVVSAIQDQSMAFKFVKWTKGEMKVGRDMILGISRIKQDALAGNKADQWFAALRKRRRSAKTFRFTETGLNPFTTLVLTTDEVEQIRQTAGYDITSRNICRKLMDNLYLLGLLIVNVNAGTVESIFDGFTEFSSTTLSAMKESRKDDMITTADQLREMKQIMGRF